VAKFIGFAVTGASSLLAEAVHSVADTGNQALLLLGDRRARRVATEAHPFGFGRERYFWAFIVSMMLFTLGGLFAVYEAVEKLMHPHELEHVYVALAILGVSLVLEGFSFRTAVREAAGLRGGHGWLSFIRRAKSPEIPVVLLEDFAALIGLVLALVGIVLNQVTANPVWDGLATLLIGLLLLVVSILLAVEMKSLLIGEAASDADQAAIEDALASSPNVERLIHLRTQHLGPDDILVAAKVDMADVLSFEEVSAAIDAAEERIRAAVPTARLVFIEPGVYVEPETSG